MRDHGRRAGDEVDAGWDRGRVSGAGGRGGRDHRRKDGAEIFEGQEITNACPGSGLRAGGIADGRHRRSARGGDHGRVLGGGLRAVGITGRIGDGARTFFVRIGVLGRGRWRGDGSKGPRSFRKCGKMALG